MRLKVFDNPALLNADPSCGNWGGFSFEIESDDSIGACSDYC